MSRLHCLLVLITLLPGLANGATPEEEIEHLLSTLDSVDCTFVRNEVSYSSRDFKLHLQSKVSRNNDLIDSAEDFIEKIGTRSAESDVPYVAVCDGELKITKNWFTELLAVYRSSN